MNETLEKLALAKWKEMLHTLSEAEQLRLRTPQAARVKEIPSEIKARMGNKKMKDYFGKDYKTHDYERELEGLERGSNEIVRKISPDIKIIRETGDVDAAVEGYIDRIEDILGPLNNKGQIIADLKSDVLSGGPQSTHAGKGGVAYDNIGFITKGNLSERAFRGEDPTNIDKDWNKYVNKERSLEQRYHDALTVRHEADEVRARAKNRLNKRFLRNPSGEVFYYGDAAVIKLTDTKHVDKVINSNHASPEVLFRESANVAIAPKAVRDVITNMRGRNLEIKGFFPDYGVNAKLDKKQMNKMVNKTMRSIESKLNNNITNYNKNLPADAPKIYSMKPIPLGPVKQSSLRTRYLEKTSALKEDVELYPHQERVIKKILDRDNTIVAHAVGSGKTLTTLAGFEKLKEQGKAKKALVVVPASLRDNYALEGVGKFTDSSYNIVGNQQELRSDPTKYGLPTSDKDYNIVSYELFRRDPKKYITESGADTVIFDELHRGKNITKTYKAIKQSRPLYNKFIGGTGSVVSNKLTDVIPLVDAATAGKGDLTRTENLRQFEDKFFIRDKNPKYKGVDDRRKPVVGLRNKNELGKFLGEYVDYTGYEDVKDLADMPDKIIHEVKVPISDEQAKAYRKLMREDKELQKLIAQRRYEYLRDDELSRVYNKMTEARKIMNDVGAVRPGDPLHETVEQSPKTKALLDDTANYLKDNPEGRVLLTSFLVRGGTEALEAGLQNRDIEYGKFIGKGNEGVTEETRQQAVRDFNEGKLRALVLSSAGGEGLSLGDTTRVNVLDPHFNPERMNQIEARGVRSGGLKYLPEEERKVDVNRYIATMPEKKLLFLKWRDRMQTPDEVIYELAKKKDKQNKILQDFLHEIT